MKFKVIVCSLLAGIFLTVGITGLYLVQEAQKQTKVAETQNLAFSAKCLYEIGNLHEDYYTKIMWDVFRLKTADNHLGIWE